MTNPTLLIAQREISTRIRAKSFLISTLATVLIFVAFAYVPKLFEMFSAGDESTTVAVVGQDIAAAYLEQRDLNHLFRLTETVLPRSKKAKAIDAIDK